MAIPNFVRAWLYLVPLVPSLLVSIFVLYHLLIDRALRTAINNHVIILLLSLGLIFELTDIVWTIHLYRTGTVLSSASAFCVTWAFFGTAMPVSIFILMAWASMERHIIIFYSNWFATKTKRLFFHYLPLATCIMYPSVFYFVMFVIIPCNGPFTSTYRLCNRYVCIAGNSRYGLLDAIANNIFPAFVTVSFSMGLFVRVIYVRYRIRGRIDWRNYKKMAGQLLPISILYILLQLPPMILYAVFSSGLRLNATGGSYYSDAVFFMYWVVLFTPFTSLVSLPDLKTKCRNLFLFWQRRGVVGPQPLTLTRSKVGQIPVIVPAIR